VETNLKIDLISLYNFHTWEVRQVKIGEEFKALQNILDDCGLRSCAAESALALNYYNKTGTIKGLFFFDAEQVFMDLDKCYGEMALGILKQDWRDYPAGSLVFAVAKIDGGCFTVGIAPHPPSVLNSF
jgi:hypothetical protein